MKVSVESNKTHWKSSDIKRLAKAALETAGCTTGYCSIYIEWDGSTYWNIANLRDDVEEVCRLYIYLPRRGPKTPHPNALVALAASGIDASTPMLAIQDSFFLANDIYYSVAGTLGNSPNSQWSRSTNPPTWWTGAPLIITKYADPAKDGTYQAFLEKSRKKMEKIARRIERWSAEQIRAEKNLKRAHREMNAAKASLKSAKARRGLA